MLDWKNPTSWSVLIVDDTPDNLELVDIFLSVNGARTKGVNSGKEALEAIKGFQPNLILLDLSMPHMSGWDLLPILRAMPEIGGDVCTIALTAHAMPSDRKRVREAGFNGYLTKPINLPTLLTDLERANFPQEPLKVAPDEHP